MSFWPSIIIWIEPGSSRRAFRNSEPQRRAQRARQRAAEFRRWIESLGPLRWIPRRRWEPIDGAAAAVSRDALAPQFPVPGPAGLTSNFTADEYCRTVQRVVDYICAGDVFQVNLAQRLLFPRTGRRASLYLRLRRRNAAPFAGYFDLGRSRSSVHRPSGSCRFGKATSRRGPSRAPVSGWGVPRPTCTPATICSSARKTEPRT
jgi:hypothetical protein